MKKQKIYILVLVGITTCGILLTIYFQNMNSNSKTKQAIVEEIDTSNWQILVSQREFSIRYPSNYAVFGENMANDPTVDSDISLTNMNARDNIYHSIFISIHDKDYTVYGDITLEEAAKADFAKSDGEIIKPFAETLLDRKQAYTYTVKDEGFQGETTSLTFVKNGIPAEISVIESENDDSHFLILYLNNSLNEKIVSTFQFTN